MQWLQAAAHEGVLQARALGALWDSNIRYVRAAHCHGSRAGRGPRVGCVWVVPLCGAVCVCVCVVPLCGAVSGLWAGPPRALAKFAQPAAAGTHGRALKRRTCDSNGTCAGFRNR